MGGRKDKEVGETNTTDNIERSMELQYLPILNKQFLVNKMFS